MLIGRWFRYGIFGILKDMDVDPVSAPQPVARAAEVSWGTRPDLDWFSYFI